MQCNYLIETQPKIANQYFSFIMCNQNSHCVDPFPYFVRKKYLFLIEIHQNFGCPIPIILIFFKINYLVFLFHLFESVLLPIVTILADSSLLSNKHSQQQRSALYKWGIRDFHGMSWHVLQPRNLRHSD